MIAQKIPVSAQRLIGSSFRIAIIRPLSFVSRAEIVDA